jgi:hypothetical protein
MNANDAVAFTGTVELFLKDKKGLLKEHRLIRNLVVTVGKGFITSRMIGAAAAVMSHMAAGTGATAAAAGNTTLGTEVGRVALTSATQTTGDVANDTVQYAATFGAGVATGALTELGLFNAGAAGDMLARTVFAVVNKGAEDSLGILWNIKAA